MTLAAAAAAEPVADAQLARFLVGAQTEPPSLELTCDATLSSVVLDWIPGQPDHAEL